MSEQDAKEKKAKHTCEECGKETTQLYDLTPAALSDITTIYVCADCSDRE